MVITINYKRMETRQTIHDITDNIDNAQTKKTEATDNQTYCIQL